MGLSQLDREKESNGGGEVGEENTETDVAAKKTKNGHSMVADMQTGQPFMHKTQCWKPVQVLFHTHTLGSQSTDGSLWVSGM